MRMIDRPSSSKGIAICTMFVHDLRPSPTRRFEPLTRLINCDSGCSTPRNYAKGYVLTVVFPLPVEPIILVKLNQRWTAWYAMI
jgi:hypothetical protein